MVAAGSKNSRLTRFDEKASRATASVMYDLGTSEIAFQFERTAAKTRSSVISASGTNWIASPLLRTASSYIPS
jgi:hypothetical protein